MIRKVLLPALFLSLMTTITYAQRTTSGSLERTRFISPVSEKNDRAPVDMDTLLGDAFSLQCSDNIISYYSDNWGYVAGNNGYLDKEKAQSLTLGEGSNFKVREVWGFFADAASVGNGALRAKVYSAAGNGAPGTLLGTSSNVSVSNVATSDTGLPPTIFSFASAPSVTGPDFFVGIDISSLYATNDTIALWSTEDGCGDGANAWEKWEDDTWHTIDDQNGWQLELEFLLGAVVEFDPVASQSEPFADVNGLRIYPATPNPAKDDILVSYDLEQGSKVTIDIYTTEGKLLQRIDKGYQAPGKQNETVDLSKLPAGAYVYGVITDKARLMSRFVVQ
ncbi:MAG: T9SS type A sorting domain-containing protein [Lewinellaceae bacterium]|nr:T9SS type A sorting domain-containing protein [Lewinellaceae bacterium]